MSANKIRQREMKERPIMVHLWMSCEEIWAWRGQVRAKSILVIREWPRRQDQDGPKVEIAIRDPSEKLGVKVKQRPWGQEGLQPMLKREQVSRGSQRAQRDSTTQRKRIYGFRKSWYKMAMQDAQEQEVSRSRMSLKKGPCHIAGIASMSYGVVVVADQECHMCFRFISISQVFQVWRQNHFQMVLWEYIPHQHGVSMFWVASEVFSHVGQVG